MDSQRRCLTALSVSSAAGIAVCWSKLIFFVVTKGNYPHMKVGSIFLNEFVAFVKSCR